jgi:hypothetical protein
MKRIVRTVMLLCISVCTCGIFLVNIIPLQWAFGAIVIVAVMAFVLLMLSEQ